MRLEFTTTAMRRPEIVRETYSSFAAHLKGVDFAESTLYINIDPQPADGSAEEVIAIAHEHFGQVIVNTPAEANFPAAVKWCWTQPGGEFFFHCEDDWFAERDVHIDELLDKLRHDPGLSLVNLRVYRHNDDRLCLAPGLWRTDHAKAIAAKMRLDANPEMQLRRQHTNNPHGGLHIGYRGLQYPGFRVLRDIGRPWRAAKGLQPNNKRDFIHWAKA